METVCFLNTHFSAIFHRKVTKEWSTFQKELFNEKLVRMISLPIYLPRNDLNLGTSVASWTSEQIPESKNYHKTRIAFFKYHMDFANSTSTEKSILTPDKSSEVVFYHLCLLPSMCWALKFITYKEAIAS